MKFTLSWLKDHLQTEASLDEIAAKLTLIGLEVEGIEDPAGKLKDFTVARVLEAAPHPNADKLRVWKVDTGSGVVQVVCGAPNARKGLIGVFAAPGVYVPGIKVTLGKASIRGVDSAGMMCSERELELSTEHSGIIELPERMKATVGERFVDVDGAARSRHRRRPLRRTGPIASACAASRAILPRRGSAGSKMPARAMRAKASSIAPSRSSCNSPRAPESACPVFAGRVIRGVSNKPSPEWMQRRLRAIRLAADQRRGGRDELHLHRPRAALACLRRG